MKHRLWLLGISIAWLTIALLGRSQSLVVQAEAFSVAHPTLTPQEHQFVLPDKSTITSEAVPITHTQLPVANEISAPSAFSCNNVSGISKSECDVLVLLYNTTNGPNWTNHTGWLVTNTPCNWYGVGCGNKHVIELYLLNNQLVGSIPAQLGNLSNLSILNLASNQLSGTIPPELGNLTKLTLLHLSGNQLTGGIPTQLGNLTNLNEFGLCCNPISGNIPTQLGNLTNLTFLSMDYNQLSGNLPTDFGNLINLTNLSIGNTQLSGALPGNLINLTNLTHFSFDSTDLCEPGDAAFQSWLATISELDRTGVICNSSGSTIVTAIATGGNDTCALTTTGGVKCWGTNPGDGGNVFRYTPVDVKDLNTGVTAIGVSSGGYACAVKNGGVKCWGNNAHGQVGNGTTSQLTPVDVVGLNSGATAISTGLWHTCAVINGGVKCWGDNRHGQLGDGTTVTRTVPINVLGLNSGVKSLAAGEFYTCALMDNGTIRCWGNNYYGQLGNGYSGTDNYVPVAVSGLSSAAIAITASGGHTCALMDNGSVKCWGDNGYGEIGDGTKTGHLAPTDVVGLSSGTTAIAAGGGYFFYTCAVNNGGAKCWGANNFGQIGDGTTTERLTPTNVVGLSSGLSNGIMAIHGGEFHTCVVTSSGGVKCWGDNTNGQLGNGTTTSSLTPVDVVGLGTGTSSTFSCTNVTEIPQAECGALVALYNSTSGANWTNHTGWMATNTPCSWYGITCGNGHVISLVLPSNQLTGTIPSQLGNLTNLQTLYMFANHLSGVLPLELGSLKNLLSLSLSDNQLSGAIPANWGNLTSLQVLHMQTNQLNGSIPPQLGNLTHLQELDFSNNQLSGSIPTELGSLASLITLSLSNNQLSGALPSSLINLTKLAHFWFNNTNLCEPSDAAIQAWLASIPDVNRTSVSCTVLPTNTFTPTPSATSTATPTNTPISTPTDTTPPPVPDGRVFTCAYSSTSGGVNNYQVHYKWNAVNDIGSAGIDQYPYWSQVSMKADFSVVNGWFNSWDNKLERTSDISFPENTTLYAHVRSRDAKDNQSTWSSTDSLVLNSKNCIPSAVLIDPDTWSFGNSGVRYPSDHAFEIAFGPDAMKGANGAIIKKSYNSIPGLCFGMTLGVREFYTHLWNTSQLLGHPTVHEAQFTGEVPDLLDGWSLRQNSPDLSSPQATDDVVALWQAVQTTVDNHLQTSPILIGMLGNSQAILNGTLDSKKLFEK